VLAILVPVLLFGIIFVAVTVGFRDFPVLYVVAFAVLTTATFVTPYIQAKRTYRRHEFLREPMVYRFMPEGIHLEGRTFSADMAWSIVFEVRETRTLFLIMHNPQTAWILPRRFLTIEEQDEWRDFVKAHLPNSSKQYKQGGVAGRLF
jgi:YcxB-like protein